MSELSPGARRVRCRVELGPVLFTTTSSEHDMDRVLTAIDFSSL